MSFFVWELLFSFCSIPKLDYQNAKRNDNGVWDGMENQLLVFLCLSATQVEILKLLNVMRHQDSAGV